MKSSSRRLHSIAAMLFLLAISAAAARADAGSPMMLASSLQLLGLNIVIGVVEGLVISRVFHVRAIRAVPVMIGANYASFPAGFLLAGLGAWLLSRPWMPPPLYAGLWVYVSLLVLSFALSVLIEWPFCWWALGLIYDRRRKSWKASVLAQAISYALLVPFYMAFGSVGLYRAARIRPVSAFVKSPAATVFYLHPRDGSLWRISTDGTGRRRVMDAHITGDGTGLSLRPSASGKTVDLWWVEEGVPIPKGPQHLLLKDIAPRSALPVTNTLGTAGGKTYSDEGEGYWFDFGGPNDFRPGNRRPWTVSAAGWMWPHYEGLSVKVPDRRVKHSFASTYETIRGDTLYDLSFHTPFATFGSSYATILPNGQVVFESAGQVLLLDEASRRLGFLARGRSPVVVP